MTLKVFLLYPKNIMAYVIGELVKTPDCMEGKIKDTKVVDDTTFYQVYDQWYREEEIFSVIL